GRVPAATAAASERCRSHASRYSTTPRSTTSTPARLALAGALPEHPAVAFRILGGVDPEADARLVGLAQDRGAGRSCGVVVRGDVIDLDEDTVDHPRVVEPARRVVAGLAV